MKCAAAPCFNHAAELKTLKIKEEGALFLSWLLLLWRLSPTVAEEEQREGGGRLSLSPLGLEAGSLPPAFPLSFLPPLPQPTHPFQLPCTARQRRRDEDGRP